MIRSWLAALVPELCPRCRGPTARGFCTGCVLDFARVELPCLVCGLPCPVKRCPGLCGAWHVEALVAPFVYTAPLDGQLRALKFDGARALGRALGLLLAAELARRNETADALIPVPLHRARLRERGYNQAAEIARIVAVELGIPLHVHGARRDRATAAQATLRLGERGSNVAGAFTVERGYAELRVALVDDVVTTGATINALAAAVRAAGARTVVAWAIARTPEPREQRATRASAAIEVIEKDPDEDRRTHPGIVRECAKASLGLTVPG